MRSTSAGNDGKPSEAILQGSPETSHKQLPDSARCDDQDNHQFGRQQHTQAVASRERHKKREASAAPSCLSMKENSEISIQTAFGSQFVEVVFVLQHQVCAGNKACKRMWDKKNVLHAHDFGTEAVSFIVACLMMNSLC